MTPLDPPDPAQWLAAIVASSDDAIVSKDLSGIVTSWNRAAEVLFGYSAAEMIGRSIRTVIPADRQSEEDETLARIRRGERLDHFETWRRRKDGSLVPISLTVSPIVDEHGRVIGASKIARDISDRLRTEEERARLLAFAQNHARITERLNQIGAAVASSLDPQTVVQVVTDAAVELTGAEFGAFFYNVVDPATGGTYTLYSLAGMPKDSLAHLPNPRGTELSDPTFRGEGPVRLDDVTTDPRYGHLAPYYGMPPGHPPVRSYLAIPVRHRSGEVLGGMFFGHSKPGVFTVAHEQLAVGVSAWASVGLENARLYESAREANQLKDQFLATLSHELRTPLNAIVGYARLLRGGALEGDRMRQAHEVIDRNATSLTQIVDDVLDVSRIISGKVRMNLEPTDVTVVVRDAIDSILPAADQKGVRVSADFDAVGALVSADAERLQQVAWNLLSNAVKFTPRGGEVRVRVSRADGRVEIVVTDTGVGIAPEFLPHVFERFRQASNGASGSRTGLGLGLAIVRSLVEAHGGHVTAESEGGSCGSTFRVSLPLLAADGDLPAGRPTASPRSAPLPRIARDLRGTRVLVVDDDRDALELAREILTAAGAEVCVVEGAQLALDAVTEFRPHVVLSDLGMPGIDGFELISRIRQSPDVAVRRVAAAALSAYARNEDRARAMRAGFQRHLSKPIDPYELVDAIAELGRSGTG